MFSIHWHIVSNVFLERTLTLYVLVLFSPKVSRIEVVTDIPHSEVGTDVKTECKSEMDKNLTVKIPQHPIRNHDVKSSDLAKQTVSPKTTKECPTCKESFPYSSPDDKSDFERHSLTHLKCSCTNPTMTFESRKSYQEHMRTSHEEKKQYK